MQIKNLKLICFTLTSQEQLSLETEASIGKDLREHIVKQFTFNKDLVMVCNGKIIKDDDSITDGSIITLTKWKDPTQIASLSGLPLNLPLTSDLPLTLTGAEVRQALKTNPELMFLLMHNIAKVDPYFLSYLAVNPIKAKNEMEKYLSQDKFTLTINGKK
jgi:hypothetical protein